MTNVLGWIMLWSLLLVCIVIVLAGAIWALVALAG